MLPSYTDNGVDRVSALGSTRLTTDGSKAIQFSSNYKPFGPQHGASGSEKVKYVGKWQDSPTGEKWRGLRERLSLNRLNRM